LLFVNTGHWGQRCPQCGQFGAGQFFCHDQRMPSLQRQSTINDNETDRHDGTMVGRRREKGGAMASPRGASSVPFWHTFSDLLSLSISNRCPRRPFSRPISSARVCSTLPALGAYQSFVFAAETISNTMPCEAYITRGSEVRRARSGER
jgi:hypothetical protein